MICCRFKFDLQQLSQQITKEKSSGVSHIILISIELTKLNNKTTLITKFHCLSEPLFGAFLITIGM